MLARLILLIAVFAQLSHGLHFYLQTSTERCFLEELPLETMVVGKYRMEQYKDQTQIYEENPVLGVKIMVDELDENRKPMHNLKDYKGASSGRFSFTSAVSATHRICFSTNSTGWFNHELARIHLDMIIGDGALDEIQEEAAEKLDELVQRVRDLNHRISDIRREQQYQRVRESEFRDASETANAKTVNYTMLQMLIMGLTAFWQSKHLKTFFQAKKLV